MLRCTPVHICILRVPFLKWACAIGLSILIFFVSLVHATTREAPAKFQRDVLSAFQQGHYDEVAASLETLPQGQEPSKELLKAGLLSYLQLGRPEPAFTAYTRLVPPGQPDEIPLLRRLAKSFIMSRLRDPEEHIRIAASTALAEVHDPAVIPLLEDGLLDASVLVRARSAEGLGRVISSHASKRPVAPSALKRALMDPTPAVRVAALHALGDVGDPTTYDLISRIAQAEDGPVHVFALAALVRLGRLEALAELRDAATLPDPETRMAALGMLGRLKRPADFSLISQLIYDPDPSVRAFAAGALGDYGNPDGAAPLIHALSDEHPRVRSIAAASLGRLKVQQARPILWQAAKDPDELVRAGAVEGLLRLGDSEAILVAADLAKHPDPSVRGAAAQALGRARSKQVLSLLDQLRQDRQPQPRLMAARALGKIRGEEAVQLLKKSLQDSDAAVRIAAAGSLLHALSSGRSESPG
jgi:HEAT repeat protein